MTSPISSDAIDIMTGKDFMGEDTRTPHGIARMLSNDLMPFYIEPFTTSAINWTEDSKRKFSSVSMFFNNLIGSRGRDISPYDLRRDERSRLAKGLGLVGLDGTPVQEWTDMNLSQQKEAKRNDPKLQQLSDVIEDDVYRRADRKTRNHLDVQHQKRADYESKMDKIAIELLDRGITKKQYDNERKRLRDERRGATGVLWDLRSLADPKLVKDMEEWILENQLPEDAATDAYWEKYEKMRNALGVMDSTKWSKLERDLNRWLKNTYGSVIIRYVIEHKNDWILDMPPNSQRVELDRVRQTESGAWWQNYDNRFGANIR
jgi:hypothetical protein